MGVMSMLTKGMSKSATKEFKFKQDALLKKATTGNQLPSVYYTYVNTGVCTALSFAWINEQISAAVFRPIFQAAATEVVQNRHVSMAAMAGHWYYDEMVIGSVKLDEHYRNMAGKFSLTIDSKQSFMPLMRHPV